ncbi:MAG: sugar transferase [Crocinitomicaceae bacterium]|nr:sugar transferase [Crocinitomicaceae bacterium]MCF8443595.1 sugar transferase [Crocinitomicaceae bacterium]
MLSFYLNRLSISSSEIQTIDLTTEFKNHEKKLIVVVNQLNKVENLQLTIENLATLTKEDQHVILQFETLKGRSRRTQKLYPKTIAKSLFIIDFIFHRVFSRLFIVKNIYSYISKGKIKILSKAEALGRMVFSGYQIESVENFDGLCTVLLKKSGQKLINKKPSFGPVFKMNRIGKNGKMIGVYKIRTMHPYSEYLQDFLIKLNGYGDQGKPKNDFRVTTWGRILRKYWIDEIPQLINVMKLEMKLVGLRPVSEYYFNELDQFQKERRLEQKPGCIPPYIAFNMGSSKDQVLKAEEMYLNMKKSKPFTTDTRVFFMAIKNIFFSKKRGS